jgi:hypothetical protein
MKKKFGAVYDEKGERQSKQEEAEVLRGPAMVTRYGPVLQFRMAPIALASRFGAHRFYLANRMSIMSHHFTLRL